MTLSYILFYQGQFSLFSKVHYSLQDIRVKDNRLYLFFIYFLIYILFSIYFPIFKLRVRVSMISHMTVTTITHHCYNLKILE